MSEGAPFGILLLEKGKPKKVFKGTTYGDGESAKVVIFIVRGDEKVKLVKKYKATYGKKAPLACLQAVIKYWKPFDPAVHNVTIIAGHELP